MSIPSCHDSASLAVPAPPLLHISTSTTPAHQPESCILSPPQLILHLKMRSLTPQTTLLTSNFSFESAGPCNLPQLPLLPPNQAPHRHSLLVFPDLRSQSKTRSGQKGWRNSHLQILRSAAYHLQGLTQHHKAYHQSRGRIYRYLYASKVHISQ